MSAHTGWSRVRYHPRAMPVPDRAPESTLSLIERARTGDESAFQELFQRYAPALRRWASGRLPRWARDLADTPDLVQETLLHTFRNIERFEHRGQGALQAYLRFAVMNRIRDELRKVPHRPGRAGVDPEHRDEGPSPLDLAIGAEVVARYDAALEQLRPDEREMVIARLEMGFTYAEIAEAVGKPSANAARMAVARALIRLAEAMGEYDRQAD